MKKLIIALFALTLIVPTIALAWGENNIGLYTTPDDTGETSMIATTGGLYDIYLVCTKPFNFNTGLPIETIGGFELTMTLPEGWGFNGVAYPAGVLDLDATAENFYCSGTLPVGGNSSLLATVTLLSFAPTAGPIFIEPYFAAPSIPGSMAITDLGDNFTISPAFPSSGDYGLPVFGINMVVVPTEDASWGGVKSLFQ